MPEETSNCGLACQSKWRVEDWIGSAIREMVPRIVRGFLRLRGRDVEEFHEMGNRTGNGGKQCSWQWVATLLETRISGTTVNIIGILILYVVSLSSPQTFARQECMASGEKSSGWCCSLYDTVSWKRKFMLWIYGTTVHWKIYILSLYNVLLIYLLLF